MKDEDCEVALNRSLDDGAVFSFRSLDRLFECSAPWPEDLRRKVVQNLKSRGEPVKGVWYHFAYVRTDDVPDGQMRWLFPSEQGSGPRAGYVLLVASDQARYDHARRKLREILHRKLLPRGSQN